MLSTLKKLSGVIFSFIRRPRLFAKIRWQPSVCNLFSFAFPYQSLGLLLRQLATFSRPSGTIRQSIPPFLPAPRPALPKSTAERVGGLIKCVQMSVKHDPQIEIVVLLPHRHLRQVRGSLIKWVSISASLLWLLSSEERRK